MPFTLPSVPTRAYILRIFISKATGGTGLMRSLDEFEMRMRRTRCVNICEKTGMYNTLIPNRKPTTNPQESARNQRSSPRTQRPPRKSRANPDASRTRRRCTTHLSTSPALDETHRQLYFYCTQIHCTHPLAEELLLMSHGGSDTSSRYTHVTQETSTQ